MLFKLLLPVVEFRVRIDRGDFHLNLNYNTMKIIILSLLLVLSLGRENNTHVRGSTFLEEQYQLHKV